MRHLVDDRPYLGNPATLNVMAAGNHPKTDDSITTYLLPWKTVFDLSNGSVEGQVALLSGLFSCERVFAVIGRLAVIMAKEPVPKTPASV